MGREKLNRKLKLKLKYKEFLAPNSDNKDTIHLLHEEIEALFLMDNLGMYQESAAKEMGISRSTFGRIIKRARQKLIQVLISGAKLKIEDNKDDLIVLIASSTKEYISVASPGEAKFLLYFNLRKGKIIQQKAYINPVILKKKRAAQVLPTFCNERGANFFIAKEICDGLRDSLLSKGVYAIKKENIKKSNLGDILFN